MKKLISLALVLVMCTLALTSCGGNSPEKVVEAMMDVMLEYDVAGAKDLLPEELWEEMYEELDVDEDEFWEDIEDTFDEMKEQMEEIDSYSVDYKIGDVDELDVDDDDAEEYVEELEDLLKEDVEGIAIVTVEISISMEFMGEEYDEETEEEYVCFKYDGNWYIHPDSADFLDTF